MDHPPTLTVVVPPHYRLLLHGKDGCIPYLTPELLRLLFCPPVDDDCKDSSNENNNENNNNDDWKWRRQHFILGVAVKDTCISALYRTVQATPSVTNMKAKRKKVQAIKEENGTKRIKKEEEELGTERVVSEILSSSPRSNIEHTMNNNRTIDEADPLHKKHEETEVIKKPCGYSFIIPAQSNQICSNIISHRVTNCKNRDDAATTATQLHYNGSNYMHTHLRIPKYISTMIVPTFSLDQPTNNNNNSSDNATATDDSFVMNHRKNGGHVSKKQPSQTIVNARKKQKQQKKERNDDGSSSIIPNSTKECISVDTPHGWQKLTPVQYWDAVVSLTSPILHNDAAPSATTTSTKSKSSSSSTCIGAVGLFDHFGLSRNRINELFALEESSPSAHNHHPFADKCGTLLQRVVQRTNGWSHCITRYRGTPDAAATAAAAVTAMPPLIEFWTPIHLIASRLPIDYLLSCPRTVHHNNIKSDTMLSQASILFDCCNVAIVGWDAVTYSRERKRQALHDIICTLQSLPSPPRQYAVLSVNNLISILDAVKAGVSIIGTDIVRHWSCSGKALCLDLTRYNSSNDDGHPQDNVPPVEKSTGGFIDLKDEQYAHDARVLIPWCRYNIVGPSFSRAYIHHLIKAKEMLAETLLFIHNLNQLLLLMHQFSKALVDNNLETYCNWIEDQL